MPTRTVFDQQYYERFYENPKTRALEPDGFRRLGEYVCSALVYLEQPVKRVLDIGCGMGYWRELLENRFPGCSYQGVEVSDYLCQRFGWKQASVVNYRSRWPYDLVICSDVLQYLDDTQARTAIDNLAQLCRGVMYFGALTREDWERNCDQSRTDEQGYLRTGKWYRAQLGQHFQNMGGGLYVSHESPVVLYELETL